MHYYQFHIGDWSLHTSHLTLEEDAVYRRLLDFYYDSETPIPEDTKTISRRLRLGPHSDLVQGILEEFFVLEDDGWHNKRADIEIGKYQARADRARENGGKGGRPKKEAEETQKEPSDNPEETQRVNNANPEETGSKANHKPITNNRQPVTSNQEPITNITKAPSADVDYSVFGMSDDQIGELIRIRKVNKGGKITQRVANALSKEFHQACAKGYTFDQLLDEWETRGWKSFKAEWMASKNNGQRSDAVQRTIENLNSVELN